MAATLDIEKLTVREVKLVQQMTGQTFGTVIKGFQTGDFDADVLHALALIYLRRANPDATEEEALDVEIMPMLGDAPGDAEGKAQSALESALPATVA